MAREVAAGLGLEGRYVGEAADYIDQCLRRGDPPAMLAAVFKAGFDVQEKKRRTGQTPIQSVRYFDTLWMTPGKPQPCGLRHHCPRPSARTAPQRRTLPNPLIRGWRNGLTLQALTGRRAFTRLACSRSWRRTRPTS